MYGFTAFKRVWIWLKSTFWIEFLMLQILSPLRFEINLSEMWATSVSIDYHFSNLQLEHSLALIIFMQISETLIKRLFGWYKWLKNINFNTSLFVKAIRKGFWNAGSWKFYSSKCLMQWSWPYFTASMEFELIIHY